MKKYYVATTLACALMLLGVLLPWSTAAQTVPKGYFAYGNPQFYNAWFRVDGVMANGTARRAYYWGAGPVSTIRDNNPRDPNRIVQYFDKGRMEITEPNGDKNSQYYVSSSLLAKEMVTGRRDVQELIKIARTSAGIPVVGRQSQPNGVTYASFHNLVDSRAEDRSLSTSGRQQQPTATLNYLGQVGDDPGKFVASRTATNFTFYDKTSGHNIPRAFWDFLNQSGLTYDCTPARCARSGPIERKLSNPWFFYSGLPISEPYWIKAQIGSGNGDVLVQVFERRTIYYNPAAAAGQQVQFADTGRHHYLWVYGEEGLGALPGQPTTAVAALAAPFRH